MKMKGFMCQSPAATAVCMTSDPRSVIVPRRHERRVVDNTPLIKNARYSRLVESRRVGHHDDKRRSVIVLPSTNTVQEEQCRQLPSLPSSENVFQVVVMKVSLHCQGCAGKVKKHLSKMEGVTSFSIDLETKRVTVMGHISPTVVLESISKVRRAEFWPC